MVELLLRAGVEPNPGPLTICTLCFNYESENKYNMTRHVKFTCTNRGQRQQAGAIRKSSRLQDEEKVRVSVDYMFYFLFGIYISSPTEPDLSTVKDGRRGRKTRRLEVIYYIKSVDTNFICRPYYPLFLLLLYGFLLLLLKHQ